MQMNIFERENSRFLLAKQPNRSGST